MPRVIWSDASRLDIQRIDEFISRENADAALAILRRIRHSAALLEQFPSIGPSLEADHRYLSVRGTSYVIVYRLQTGQVEVSRARHVREDWFPAAWSRD